MMANIGSDMAGVSVAQCLQKDERLQALVALYGNVKKLMDDLKVDAETALSMSVIQDFTPQELDALNIALISELTDALAAEDLLRQLLG